MERLEQINKLNHMLLQEMPAYAEEAATCPEEEQAKRRLLRGLMNLRPPMPLQKEYLELQDELLTKEREQRGVIDVWSLPACEADDRIVLWQGDITRLCADAIVNAANSGMTGCYHPNHNCIDNCIHSAAGAQLRWYCYEMMQKQGHEEPTGQAKITPAYNLPAEHIIHTVGPIVNGALTKEHERLLASSYQSCLSLAAENKLTSIVFPCISTGVFGFPQKEAAQIAIRKVREFLSRNAQIKRVVFNVFKDEDAEIYSELLAGLLQ